MSVYTVKPLDDLTIFNTQRHKRKNAPFKVSWSRNLSDLRSELRMISATDAVLELAVQPRDIRLDGELRADARQPSHPGIRLSFHTRDYGDLAYTCDTYTHWRDNLRGIVLTLKSLRAIDRYGATKGEQYAGFKALPAGSGATPVGGMTKEQAIGLLYELSGLDVYKPPEEAFRVARAKAHPDRNNGGREVWDRVELAGKIAGYVR